MRLTRALLATLVGVGMLVVSASPAQAVPLTVCNLGAWDGTTPVCAWGTCTTETYGEILPVPCGVCKASSVSFFIRNGSGGPQQFQAGVGKWCATNLHPVCFTFGPVATTSGSTSFQEVTESLGCQPVTPGSEMVVFYTATGICQTATTNAWGFEPGTGGCTHGFVFSNCCCRSAAFSSPWDTALVSDQAAFSVTFDSPLSSAPEPPLGLLLGSFLGVGLLRKTFFA